LHIPIYWAQASRLIRLPDCKTYVRRFGWSNTDAADAQTMADARLSEAIRRLQLGEELQIKELKKGYNGGDGVPIREEIVLIAGESIITRNVYGALCLNTPNVMFVDIDFDESPRQLHEGIKSWPHPWLLGTFVAILWVAASIFMFPVPWTAGRSELQTAIWQLLGLGLCGFAVGFIAGKFWTNGIKNSERDDDERQIQVNLLNHIRNIANQNPDWTMRVYRTPAGYRVLMCHQTFQPEDPQVQYVFDKLKADPIYVRMCHSQQCFRARVSPKPWRTDLTERPLRKSWPIEIGQIEHRQKWIKKYELASAGYASCRFIEQLGSAEIDATVAVVMRLHDDHSKALSDMPLA
jgi:hypothetical protein